MLLGRRQHRFSLTGIARTWAAAALRPRAGRVAKVAVGAAVEFAFLPVTGGSGGSGQGLAPTVSPDGSAERGTMVETSTTGPVAGRADGWEMLKQRGGIW